MTRRANNQFRRMAEACDALRALTPSQQIQVVTACVVESRHQHTGAEQDPETIHLEVAARLLVGDIPTARTA